MQDATNSAAPEVDAPTDVIARTMRNLYYPNDLGYIFACTKMTVTVQLPFNGIVALTADHSEIELTLDRHMTRYRALAACERELCFTASSTRLVYIAVNPLHPLFRVFALLSKPGILRLDRSLFAHLDPLLDAAVTGSLSLHGAKHLFAEVLNIARNALPPMPPVDTRVHELVRLLWSEPKCSVTQLADHLGLSYTRTCHLFVEGIGIPVRTYQLWRKMFQAAAALIAGASITEAAHSAGFADAAHYSSAFQRAYGIAPSEIFSSRRACIRVHHAWDDADRDRSRGSVPSDIKNRALSARSVVA